MHVDLQPGSSSGVTLVEGGCPPLPFPAVPVGCGLWMLPSSPRGGRSCRSSLEEAGNEWMAVTGDSPSAYWPAALALQ